MFKIGDYIGPKKGGVVCEVLRQESTTSYWVKVIEVDPDGSHSYLEPGIEGEIHNRDNWILISRKPNKKEEALGIECESFNKRRER